ncbi:MAG: phospholipase [Acidimicrobiales bacterium]
MSGGGEQLPPPSGPGTVVLDLGGDVGAAVVSTPPSLVGEELEIRPASGEWTGRHVAVLPRPLGPETRYAAVFPSLESGRWVVRRRHRPDDSTEVELDVEGGRVTSTAWPG